MTNDLGRCRCQSCQGEILVPYIRLGIPQRCFHCLRLTIPTIPDREPIPSSGYSLSYEKFESLIIDDGETASVVSFFQRHFGYSLSKQFDSWMIFSASLEAINPAWLHFKIQDSPELSSELYNIAMTIWHS